MAHIATRVGAGWVALLLGWSCSGGGGTGSAASSFEVSALSLADGSVWQINREIVVSFNEAVDFSSVSSNTIHIRSLDGMPATGSFHLRDAKTVVFQPSCPRRADLADAGLQPGGVEYVLRILGRDSSANTVRSASGVPLRTQHVRAFRTPASTLPWIVFQDARPGPPLPIVRSQGSADPAATYLEIGGEGRVYFELDPSQELVLSEPGFQAPLNLYSDPSTRVAVEVAFDQPVHPADGNISEGRLRLEFREPSGTWRPIRTRVTLETNCSETGARVRLEPVGVLPPASAFRAVVRVGFQDLVGETQHQTIDAFARAPTRVMEFTSLDPADRVADALDESFDFDSESPLSFEDDAAVLDAPLADWGGGRLSAMFAFDGTGGPNGDFDWVVRTGERFVFDTTSTEIVGGPNGVPTGAQVARNGVVDVRNLVIQPDGEIRVQGPNPMRIRATGDVRIEGVLDLSGFSAKDVVSLNTGHLLEVGGAGAAGGGRGGNANENISGQTPRGGAGFGPSQQPDLGGRGGEMGVSNRPGNFAYNMRRPGGGGGGHFAKDWGKGTDEFVAPGISLISGPGSDGHPESFGAISGVSPSRGGESGIGPFLDASDENDFFGRRPVMLAGQVEIVRGELPGLWAGYGGGGGGNAGKFFPDPAWDFTSDEKGGGGGGAAGGLHIRALGRIVFAGRGEILANGATGGTGENTGGLDHMGGTGGGGSAGHVILESATAVDFTGGVAGLLARERIQAGGPPRKTGQLSHFPACCRTYSNGGAGGAGVIQIHVPDPSAAPSDDPTHADIIVPTDALALTDPLDALTSPPPYVLLPTFGSRSKARSQWISIGGADQRPDGSEGLVRFLFDGIDASGEIRTLGSRVEDLQPLLTIGEIGAATDLSLLPDGFTLELTGAALLAIREGATSGISNDVYLRAPTLLEDCAVRLGSVSTPANFLDYDVAAARYDEGTPTPGDEVLRVTVTSERGRLGDFNPGRATSLELMPRFFRVVTNGRANEMPPEAVIRIQFQAASADDLGEPDERNPLVDWTADITRFNALPAGALQFFRYEIEFDLGLVAPGTVHQPDALSLEFLEIPFVF